MTNIQPISGRIQASHNLPTWGILNIHFVTISTSGVRSPRHMSTGLPADWVDFWIFWFWFWLLDINTWLCDGRLYQCQPCWERWDWVEMLRMRQPGQVGGEGCLKQHYTNWHCLHHCHISLHCGIVRRLGQESHISTTFPGLVTTELLIYWYLSPSKSDTKTTTQTSYFTRNGTHLHCQ